MGPDLATLIDPCHGIVHNKVVNAWDSRTSVEMDTIVPHTKNSNGDGQWCFI